MAKDSAKKSRALPVRTIVRYGLIAVVMCLVLVGGISASERLQQFLTRDPDSFCRVRRITEWRARIWNCTESGMLPVHESCGFSIRITAAVFLIFRWRIEGKLC